MNERAHPEERAFSGFSQGGGYEGRLQDKQYYRAKVIGLKERNIEQGQWPGWKVIWGFDIIDPPERIEAMTSQATGEGSKAGEWLTALLGAARLEEHRTTRPISMSEVAGLECMVLIAFNDKGWPKVTAVFPPQAVAPAPVQAAPQQLPPPPTTTAADFDDLPF